MKLIKQLMILSFSLLLIFYTRNIIDIPPTHVHRHVAKISVPHTKETNFECLQTNLYFEAESEGEEGMKAVANVVINRMHDPNFPKTACAVIHQPKQFSWYGHKWKSNINRHVLAWKIAGKIAKAALSGHLNNNVGNCEYFHRVSVHPKWSDEKEMVIQIGNHMFYKDRASLESI